MQETESDIENENREVAKLVEAKFDERATIATNPHLSESECIAYAKALADVARFEARILIRSR